MCGLVKPTGFIGTNKSCAADTVHALADDFNAGRLTQPRRGRVDLDRLVLQRQPAVLDMRGWRAIDAAEIARGAAGDRPREKFLTVETLGILLLGYVVELVVLVRERLVDLGLRDRSEAVFEEPARQRGTEVLVPRNLPTRVRTNDQRLVGLEVHELPALVLVDGLVDAGIFVDDSSEYILGPDHRRDTGRAPKYWHRVRFVIVEQEVEF